MAQFSDEEWSAALKEALQETLIEEKSDFGDEQFSRTDPTLWFMIAIMMVALIGAIYSLS